VLSTFGGAIKFGIPTQGAPLAAPADWNGNTCSVWWKDLDSGKETALTGSPVGQPFDVYHSHDARRSLMNAGTPPFYELSLTADTLLFNLGETTGNIWMAEW
jgi:hypothetical protein